MFFHRKGGTDPHAFDARQIGQVSSQRIPEAENATPNRDSLFSGGRRLGDVINPVGNPAVG